MFIIYYHVHVLPFRAAPSGGHLCKDMTDAWVARGAVPGTRKTGTFELTVKRDDIQIMTLRGIRKLSLRAIANFYYSKRFGITKCDVQ